jgi:hypothetical protein
VKTCPKNNIYIDEKNKICITKEGNNCNLDNCIRCNKINQCEKCQHGFYIFENKCKNSCPIGLRANRSNFTCSKEEEYSFFFILPSKNSCKDKCGYFEQTADCSCHHHCMMFGNCCDDFTELCQEEILEEKCESCKKCLDGSCILCDENSVLKEGKCICNEGFEYDPFEDACLKKTLQPKKSMIQTPKIVHQSPTKSSFKEKHNGFINENNILGSLPTFLSGSTFEGNDNPIIKTENVINENVYNNYTKIEKNRNSKNIISGKMKNHIYGGKPKVDKHHVEEDETKDVNHGGDEQGESSWDNFEERLKKAHLLENFNHSKNLTQVSLLNNLPHINNKQETIMDNKHKLYKRKSSEKINIDKHFHQEHLKNYPKDLLHEEGVPLPLPEEKHIQEDHDIIPKSQTKIIGVKKQNKTSLMKPKKPMPSEDNPKYQNKNQKQKQEISSLTSDKNKNVQLNINIPGISGGNIKDLISKSNITVYNHYFINDKSYTMKHPNNTKILNLYENNFHNFTNTDPLLKDENWDFKFIKNKNFTELNKTLTLNKEGVFHFWDQADKFLLPKSEEKQIKSILL